MALTLNFLLHHNVLQRQDFDRRPFWVVLLLEVKVGWGCHLPVLSIQPMASPCQQADPSCRFLPMISKCFKEHGHLLLRIC